MLALAATGLPAAAATPKAAPGDALRQQCFKLQRELAQAFQAYCQDARNPRKDVGTYKFFQQLIKQGFLTDMPIDPGQGPDSYGHFRYRKGGNAITCVLHGDPDRTNVSQKDACSSVQRQILRAIDQLTRDEGAPAVTEVGTRRFFEKLVAKGYLQDLPKDPGQGKESYKNYRTPESGSGVECSVHGAALVHTMSDTEKCWRQQSTISRAVEQFNMEKSVNRTDIGNKAFFQLLVREGFLIEVPLDPGQGPESFANYRYTPDANHVECAIHGRRQ